MSFRDPVIMPGLFLLRHKGMPLFKHKLYDMGMTCSLFFDYFCRVSFVVLIALSVY